MTDIERVARFERGARNFRRSADRMVAVVERMDRNGDAGAGQVVDQLRDLIEEPPALEGSLAATVRRCATYGSRRRTSRVEPRIRRSDATLRRPRDIS